MIQCIAGETIDTEVMKMGKTAIVTDSNSGITQAEAKELGITVIAMPFHIQGTDFYEDVNLTQAQFY